MNNSQVGQISYIARIDSSKLGKDSKNVEEKINKIGDSNDRTADRSTRAWSTFAKVGLAGVAAAAVTVGAAITKNIGGAIRRVDTLNNSKRTFANMGFDAGDAKSALDELNKSIMGLPTSLDDGVRGMTSLAATYGDINKGQKIFSALNNAILGFGGTADSVNNAILQLSQLPMDGPLDAQTWNSLRNSGLTPVLVAMSKDMGISVNEMKKQFGRGDLTVKNFTDRLVKMNKDGGGGMKSLEKIAKDSTKGIGTGFTNMGTAIQRGIGSVIEAVGSKRISNAITSVGKTFESSLNLIAKSVPTVISVVSTLAPLVVKLAVAVGVYKGAAIATNAVLKLQTLYFAATGTKVLFMNGTLVALRTTTVAATIAQTALNTAMKLNPVGLLTAAVVGIVAAYASAVTQTNSVKNATDRLKTAQDALKTSTDLLKQAEQSVTDARLAREGSDIAVQRAEQRLTELRKSGTASALDLKEAEYNLKVAKDAAKKAALEEAKAVKIARDAKETDRKNSAAVVKAQNDVAAAARRSAGGYQLLADNITKAVEADKKTGKIGQGKNTTNAIFGVPGRASGGNVSAGMPYFVGENPDGSLNRTSELFVPKTSGSIMNSSDLQKALGGGRAASGTTIENNIGTINIADQSTADYFIRKLSGNQEITSVGLIPNQKYMGA